ncbi:arginine-glutamic acid dipeptide repeats protein-like [Temnothorax curvispinosus]|uniref:Arginine-glutamic acid dipeptide repeats protein-like n=1 Tax=Temnothorax curvispinosus TaxID=300111 RepID=A0A6J1R7Z9_9HYME|nr:arginine-glutamic acid dipeptide repeats protein-like [Temnothorax curvispinosus]
MSPQSRDNIRTGKLSSLERKVVEVLALRNRLSDKNISSQQRCFACRHEKSEIFARISLRTVLSGSSQRKVLIDDCLLMLTERPVDFSLSGGRESRASSDAPADSDDEDDDEIDVLGDETPSPTPTPTATPTPTTPTPAPTPAPTTPTLTSTSTVSTPTSARSGTLPTPLSRRGTPPRILHPTIHPHPHPHPHPHSHPHSHPHPHTVGLHHQPQHVQHSAQRQHR